MLTDAGRQALHWHPPYEPEKKMQFDVASQYRFEKVYMALEGERKYQEQEHPGSPDLLAFIGIMEVYLFESKLAATFNGDNEGALDAIRKVTALGVKAMEVHGVVERE